MIIFAGGGLVIGYRFRIGQPPLGRRFLKNGVLLMNILNLKKQPIILALLLISVSIFIGWLVQTIRYWPRYDPDLDAVSPDYLKAQILEDRKQSTGQTLTEEQFKRYLYPYTELVDEEKLEQLAFSGEPVTGITGFLTQNPLLFGSISVEEAREDVNLLFTSIKYGYVLYEYYGGDDIFGTAKEQILTDIADRTANRNTISKREFRQIFLEHLDFVQDGHAIFAGQSLLQHYDFFYSEKITFSRDDAGFYTLIKGDRYYLQKVIPESGETVAKGSVPVEDYIKLSLDPDGRLVYILGTLAQVNQQQLNIRITLTNGEETTEQKVILLRRSNTGLYQPVVYKRSVENNITIITNRSTAPSTEPMRSDLDRFVADAAQIADLDVAILDLRDHSGGQWQPTLQWAETLAGTPISFDKHDAKLRTRTALTLKQYFANWYLRGNEERLIQSTKDINSSLLRLQSFDPARDEVWSTDHSIDDQPDLLPNDTHLFVLIDRHTASAGEHFIHFLRQIDHVVFVGENTRGMNLSGEPAWGTLPNSGLSFQLPVDMTLTGGWVEGAGYAPDIWVNPSQSLDRVLQFIEREQR